METAASNYRAAATLHDATCTYLYPGCLASAAFNYDATANQAGLNLTLNPNLTGW